MGPFRKFWGRNTAVLGWVVRAVKRHILAGITARTLHFIATNSCFRLWRKFCMSIDGIRKALGCSRSSVEKALKVLRDLKLIAYDGQVHVGKGRPVAVYRLSGTLECPLPEWVVRAREEAREAAVAPVEEDGLTCAFTHRTNMAGPAVYATPQGETPEEQFMHPAAGVSQYRPALPVKTGPQAKPQPSGGVRRPSHLRWLRSVAESVVGRRGTPNPKTAARGAESAPPAVAGGLRPLWSGPFVVAQAGAVTYCHPPTRGAAVTPFTDPALGALPRDTRLFYLGLLDLHSHCGDRTPADALFLKSQIFPYDADIDQRQIHAMIETLSSMGKVHIASGRIVLSDPPPITSQELALFDAPAAVAAPPVRARSKAAKAVEDPWFAAFWDAYPRRTGRGAARKAFAAAVAAGADPRMVVITASAYAERCVALQKEPQFIPHPSTWLNQERWDDDEEQAPRVRSKVDDAMRSGLDLVNFYQQQEAIDPNGPGELGW